MVGPTLAHYRILRGSLGIALTFFALLLAGAASSSSPASSGSSNSPETLIYGGGLVPRGLNPLLDRNQWNEVSSLLLGRLFRADHRGQIVGDLVESYTVSDNGLTYTLRLRPNARWHDGQPLTSDDVLFTWQKLFDPATQTKLHLNQPMLESFEKAGPREIIFHLRYADAGLLAPLTEVPILPAHILAGADINSDAFDHNPVGSGPYRLVERKGNDEFIFERHEAYHFAQTGVRMDGAPAIRRLVLRIIPDDDARAEALARGEVHLAQVKPQHVARLQAMPGVKLYRMRTGIWRGMPLNLRRAALADLRVRRAIDLALDREAIVAQALAGFGQPAYSPIPPNSWAFDPAMNRRRYDPARAARLFDAAGWKLPVPQAGKDADGWRVRDGQALALEVIVWKDEVFRRTTGELVRAQLGKLGIRVNLHLVDGTTYSRLSDNMGTDYDTFIGGWGGLLDPGDNLAKKFHSRGSQNYNVYSSAEVDRLLAQARATRAQAQARRLYRRIVALLTADAVFLPLAYADYVFAADARLAGLGEPAPSGVEGFVCDSWYEFPKFAHEWRWEAKD